MSQRLSALIIAITLVFSCIAVIFCTQLKFSYDFEEFFPKEDDDFKTYMDFREKFEHDNEFILLAIEHKNGIFNQSFLIRIDSLTELISKIPDVQSVSSPTNLKKILLGGLLPVKVPLLHFKDKKSYVSDSVSIYTNENYVGSFFPKNSKSLSIYIKTNEGLSKKRSDNLANNLTQVVRKFEFEDYHLVGRVIAQKVYLEKLQHDFLKFLLIAFVLVVIFLWISFRTVSGILIPVIVVLISILWTLGIMGAMNKPIDIMTVMLPTMIFITGMSDVVHFFSKYFEESGGKKNNREIIKLVFKEVGFPTFLTLLTTAAGFLSLLFSSIQPIRDFGIFTTIGISIAFLLTYTLLPTVLLFVKPDKLTRIHTSNNTTLASMRSSLFWIFRNPKTILFLTLLIVGVFAYGTFKISVNSVLLEDLDNSIKEKQDFLFFDKYYSGVRPVELELKTKSNLKIWDYKVMAEINRLDSFLKNKYGAGFLISPASIVRELNSSIYESNPTSSFFPEPEDYPEIKKYLVGNKNSKAIKRLMTIDGNYARITGKIQDLGSQIIHEKNEKLKHFISENINSEILSVRLTGTGTLLDKNNDYMVNNMLQGFLFSILTIGLLTWILHRSFKMVLVFILPN